MKFDRRLIFVMLAPGAVLGLWLVLGGLLLRTALDPDQGARVDEAMGPLVATHGILAFGWWLVAAALFAWVARQLYEAYIAAPARLADATRTLAGDAAAPDLALEGGPPARALAEAINRLAGQRRSLQQEMARLVADASRNVAEQRDQLGALMAELDQSVVVCNRDGRILLYNARARMLFRALSAEPPSSSGGAEMIGLGRSIYGVIDRPLIAHAIETVERRRTVGAPQASARFVTVTKAGHLIRVSMAPVRHDTAEGSALSGFVFLLDDITDQYDADSRRDRHLLAFTEASRASLASLQAALEIIDLPDLAAGERERFLAVLRDEVATMNTRLAGFTTDTARDLTTRWPLQEMLGADLLAAAQRRIETEQGQSAALEAVDHELWLNIDSFALVQAIGFLAGRLGAALGRPDLRLRLTRAGSRAHFDLVWLTRDTGAEALQDWQNDPMQTGGAGSLLTVRDVAERHGGEVWIEHDRAARLSFFRFLLPLAASEPASTAVIQGDRPEYYDFDLLAGGDMNVALDERLLSTLAYTVFDTETTGLDPAQGDEIVQIGAVRIVNGRLLRGESFDQLIDPRRSIPEASTRIHGISPEMVRGQPTILQVLPAFHAFASDTVLVGHNVAFDMRFLKLKEDVCGVRFDQPVLDTLLLSNLTHPNETSHSLEAIAGRLGARASARHTALGDAVTTAEVFIKLLPLLRQRGILTLLQAREAARSTYHARLRY